MGTTEPESSTQAHIESGRAKSFDNDQASDVEEVANVGHAVGALPVPPIDAKKNGLHRGLSARQVSMIAIAGTIGTGLFLGTGRSLAQGGPASMLICYTIVGFVVYVTLLLLGEMGTQYPVAGMVPFAVHTIFLVLTIFRIFQRVRCTVLFTIVWICTVVELLVQ